MCKVCVQLYVSGGESHARALYTISSPNTPGPIHTHTHTHTLTPQCPRLTPPHPQPAGPARRAPVLHAVRSRLPLARQRDSRLHAAKEGAGKQLAAAADAAGGHAVSGRRRWRCGSRSRRERRRGEWRGRGRGRGWGCGLCGAECQAAAAGRCGGGGAAVGLHAAAAGGAAASAGH